MTYQFENLRRRILPISLTATELLAAMENGQLSAAELAHSLVEQASRCQNINALINFDADRFLSAAEESDKKRAAGELLGPLHGLPLVAKDNIDVAGFPTTASTPALANNRPSRTSPVMQKLINAGAIVMAKANMHELAFSPGIAPPEDGGEIIYGAHGSTRNPYDLERSPAGSSTGTAAAIGAHIAPAGLGTDTGGSVRNPAAWCGISGLRPTIKRYDQKGVVPISWTRDTIGPMARSVADLALLDQVISGEDENENVELSSLRLGIYEDFFCTDADPEILTVYEREVARLKDAGVDIVNVEIPELEETIADAGQGISLYEVVRSLPKYLDDVGAEVSIEDVFDQVAASGLGSFLNSLLAERAFPEEDYLKSVETYRPALQKMYSDSFIDYKLDALIFPATLVQPFNLQTWGMHCHKGKEISQFAASSHNVQPASIGGSPGLTVAAGLSNSGLPVALGFDGPNGGDRKLLAIGLAYEAIRPPIPAPNQ